MTKALKRGENSTRQRLFGAFSYIFISVRLFDARTALFIKALNAVICSPADPCLLVKWANLPSPFREATTKNSKQRQSARNCDWLGLGMLCSRRFPAPSQNLTSSIIPLLILICNFFFSSIHTQIQNDRRRGAKENKGTQFVILPPSPTSPPRLQTDANAFLQVLFLLSLAIPRVIVSEVEVGCIVCDASDAARLSPAPNVYILDIISGCPHSILGRNQASFIFCVVMRWRKEEKTTKKKKNRNSLQGITLLETRITYVVSQTRPSSLFIPLVQMTSESSSA